MQGRATRIRALGDRVAVDCGWFWHVGNVSGFAFDGQPLVVSASKRRRMDLEETLAEFSGGRSIRHDGYWSHLPRPVVAARLLSMIGQPWHLFRNCEHVAALAERLRRNPLCCSFALSVVRRCRHGRRDIVW